MPDTELCQPLLTIAVPTYNRAEYLQEFLHVLAPQLDGVSGVDLLVCDNASTDATQAVIEGVVAGGLRLRSVRHTENIGSDRNFAACFREARGRYFWLCGDDDIIRPGAIASILQELQRAEYDLVYLAPEGFVRDWRAEHRPDPFGRGAQVMRSARQVALTINVMVTFISGIIIHRDRLLALGAEPPEAFAGTHLIQLSWTLPLLRHHRQSLVLWQRWVAGRSMNGGGYSVAEVFGQRFQAIVKRLLPDQPGLAAIFTNFALRRWFPATILGLRQTGTGERFALGEAEMLLRRTFASNFRFWLFTWPVMRLPMEAARHCQRIGVGVSKVVEWLLLPGDTMGKIRRRLQTL